MLKTGRLSCIMMYFFALSRSICIKMYRFVTFKHLSSIVFLPRHALKER